MDFYEKNIITLLENLAPEEKEQLPFGVIGFDANYLVRIYNSFKSKCSGFLKDFVIGKNIFIDIAPCMNNYLVALKFEEKAELDEIIPYILSFKVKPVKVELRLLKSKQAKLSYVLIKR